MPAYMPEWEFRQIRDHLRACDHFSRAADGRVSGCRDCDRGIERLAVELDERRRPPAPREPYPWETCDECTELLVSNIDYTCTKHADAWKAHLDAVRKSTPAVPL